MLYLVNEPILWLTLFLPTGQKYEFAKKWKIHIVNTKWLYDSVDAGYCQEEHKYKVEPPDEPRLVKTSTPTKNVRGMASVSSYGYSPTYLKPLEW